jgi:hypothetical protein
LNCQKEYVETPIGLCFNFFVDKVFLRRLLKPINGAPKEATAADFNKVLLFILI